MEQSFIPNSLTDKLKERDRVYSELNRSLAIQNLVPDAFKTGGAKSKWVLNGYNEPRKFIVTNSEGVEFEFMPEDVPKILHDYPPKIIPTCESLDPKYGV